MLFTSSTYVIYPFYGPLQVVQAINSKQLFPTMRTQYMRTAFQIPFDATVRISLDTNLCMISERVKEVYSGDRWWVLNHFV